MGETGTETYSLTESTRLFTVLLHGYNQIQMTTITASVCDFHFMVQGRGGGGGGQRCFLNKNVETARSWLLLSFQAGCKEEVTCWHRGVDGS